MGGLVCWRCGASLKDIPLPFTRLQQCTACHADLHVCRLCRFYNPRISDKCDHDLAEPARDVEVANFCHYFRPVAGAFDHQQKDNSDDAMAKLKSLFGDDQSAQADNNATESTASKSDYDKAKEKFDSLFKKDES